MMRLPTKRTIVAALAATLGAVALGQTPTGTTSGSPTDTLYLSTTVGSFKFLPENVALTRGTMDIDFEGTVMVSGLNGTAVPGGAVRLEYNRDDHKRKVFFGKGHLRVSGEFRAIQFFGRNLKGTYKGVGVARLYGEFDKKMETGYFWYASNPKKIDWGTYGRTVYIPPKSAPVPAKPKVRDEPKKVG